MPASKRRYPKSPRQRRPSKVSGPALRKIHSFVFLPPPEQSKHQTILATCAILSVVSLFLTWWWPNPHPNHHSAKTSQYNPHPNETDPSGPRFQNPLPRDFNATLGPSFNIFPAAYNGGVNTDYPLLDARNVSNGEAWSSSKCDHDKAIWADPGDVLEFLIYYHNGAPAGVPENIAHNVSVKANISPFTYSRAFTVRASISAWNAPTIDSSMKGGPARVYVTSLVPQTLTLEPNSTIWYSERASYSTKSFSYPNTNPLPRSILGSGILLNSVEGCWQHAGFVKFRVRVSDQPLPYVFAFITLFPPSLPRSLARTIDAHDTPCAEDPVYTRKFWSSDGGTFKMVYPKSREADVYDSLSSAFKEVAELAFETDEGASRFSRERLVATWR